MAFQPKAHAEADLEGQCASHLEKHQFATGWGPSLITCHLDPLKLGGAAPEGARPLQGMRKQLLGLPGICYGLCGMCMSFLFLCLVCRSIFRSSDGCICILVHQLKHPPMNIETSLTEPAICGLWSHR